jgi:hypothetical protein
MSRTSSPDPEKILKLAREKTEHFSTQVNKLDDKAVSQYLGTDRKSLYSPKGTDGSGNLRPVSTGLYGFMVDQDVSVLHTTPFNRVLGVGPSPDADKHASGVVESWLNTAIWIGTGGIKVWDKGNVDLQTVGRFWSKVLTAPQMWADKTLDELLGRLNAAEGEARAGIAEEIADYRANPANFPIRWIYVSPRGTWPIYDERGMSEVVEMRKISPDVVEDKLGRLPKDLKNKKEIEVIEWSNDVYVATLLPGEGGWKAAVKSAYGGKRGPEFLGEPWEHGLGVNPYVLIEGNPLPDNDEGFTWRGGPYHMMNLMPVIDEVMSDFCTNLHSSTVTPPIVTVNLEERAALGIEEKTIDVKENETVKMYTGKGWREEAGRFPTATVNPDALKVIDMAMNFASIGGLNRPALAGISPSGQAGVTLETARQIASGELKIPHNSLQVGFQEIGSRFLRAVSALGKKYPALFDEIVVRAEDKKHSSKEITVKPKDVRPYVHLVRGDVVLNIPVNEGANVTNAAMATKVDNPLLSNSSALKRYYRHENPEEEGEKIFAQGLQQDFRALLREAIAQRAGLTIEGAGAGSLEAMAESAGGESAGGMGLAAQEALADSYETPPDALTESITRGRMNMTRTNRGQRPSQLKSMNIEVPRG